ncbi:unnamed protein product [Arctia plantaginis]|uniref:CRAL-TRIO domain-containing protein n=1 Tax=Arctia plantaginis TaxID=874455 RepID=A0A8S1BP54_ARCPL|nr:unnamed protein product [Arctia plantaginis]CAB3260689.1 unnamed protein product [Arctia plantaginis]
MMVSDKCEGNIIRCLTCGVSGGSHVARSDVKYQAFMQTGVKRGAVLYRSGKPKENKTKEIKTISSYSETDISLRESSASPFDVFEENEEEDAHEEPVDPENVKDGAYVLMTQVYDRDVEAIKQWLAKEQYLPKTFDDEMIKKFLFSCYSSLEMTKKCINEFCTRRANMPEIFTKRDPMSKEIQKYYSITAVTKYTDGKNEILIYLLKDVPDDFDHYQCSKTLTTQIDNWLKYKYDVLPEHHIVVLDMQHYTLKLMTKIKMLHLKMLIGYLLEGVPIRLKQVHFINCPPFYEYIYNLVKPAFPEYLCNLMHFHIDYTGLYKFVNQASLPKDYGGDGQSMDEQNAFWIKNIIEQREFYLDDNLWKADLSQIVRKGNSDTSMSGSFKTLEFD